MNANNCDDLKNECSLNNEDDFKKDDDLKKGLRMEDKVEENERKYWLYCAMFVLLINTFVPGFVIHLY